MSFIYLLQFLVESFLPGSIASQHMLLLSAQGIQSFVLLDLLIMFQATISSGKIHKMCINNVRASFQPIVTHVFSRLTWQRPSADLTKVFVLQISKRLNEGQGFQSSPLVHTVTHALLQC